MILVRSAAFGRNQRGRLAPSAGSFRRLTAVPFEAPPCLPITHERGLHALFYHQDWLVKDFKVHAESLSCQIADHAKALAHSQCRPFLILEGHHDKEQLVQNLLQRQPMDQGLIAVLQTLEPCRSFKVVPGPKRPLLKVATRKCRFFYFYYLDREFGLMHVRIQSWMPFPIQVYINGHSWLARKMDRHGMGYHRIDNAFAHIEDLPSAQRFASRLAHKNWPRILESFARRINPLMNTVLSGDSYYWVCDQCELALDILFRDRASLACLYKQLLEHATRCFGAEDVLTFFGRKLHGNLQAEVLTDYKVRRGALGRARIKHRLGGNWIKMYDKAAQRAPDPTDRDGHQPAPVFQGLASRQTEGAMGPGVFPHGQEGHQPAPLLRVGQVRLSAVRPGPGLRGRSPPGLPAGTSVDPGLVPAMAVLCGG